MTWTKQNRIAIALERIAEHYDGQCARLRQDECVETRQAEALERIADAIAGPDPLDSGIPVLTQPRPRIRPAIANDPGLPPVESQSTDDMFPSRKRKPWWRS